mgnify:CR=1 FL=1|tara:strand:+ start:5267 stop:5881 length:615 start_codon:yes stop_codon:yes gene_type:complete
MFRRRLEHLNTKYVWNRIKVFIDEKKNPSHPWLTQESVFLLNQLIKPTDVGVEFGSGRSTVWFAERLAHLTSIENNYEWFDKVNALLKASSLEKKVSYKIVVEPDEYVEQATLFEDNSIDFCLVDGIERDRCALLMSQKLKSNGILIIDNVNWFISAGNSHSPDSMRPNEFASSNWKKFYEHVKFWRSIWTTNGVTDTCIYIKP